MSTINDGGPAFPVCYQHNDVETGEIEVSAANWGMSLRDWFAGQALAGILANQALLVRIDVESSKPTRDAAADYALAVADSVLKARGK